MAINPASFSSQPIYENTDVTLEVIKGQAPLPEQLLDPPQLPGKLFAYYNGANDTVRLYIVNGSGLRLLPL